MTTGEPLAVLIPESNQDIATAIDFAKHHQLPFSVRSGGHSGMGYSTNNDGIVLDMRHFKNVTVLDKEAGIVRIGSGALWGEVASQLASEGLVISAGDTSSVGVGGLTLGGGIGIMVRKYGLAIDQLIGAELVTAEGKTLMVNENENSDLFWAIRGGGGNFGVITHFDFAAHPLRQVCFGTVMYKLDDIKTLLTAWRNVTRESPREVTTTLVVMPGFGGNPPSAQMYYCYAGPETEGDEALQPFLGIAPVVSQNVKAMPYKDALQEAHPPAGVVPSVKDGIIKTLDDEIIDILTTEYTGAANKMMFLRSLGGAVNDHAADETAYAHREHEVLLVCAAFMPEKTPPEEMANAMEFFDQKIAPLMPDAYPNFFTLYDDGDFARMYPAETLERLKAVKAAYDPDNVFSLNYNILPQ
jgi:FAD/FMN-containing dehydrogenase